LWIGSQFGFDRIQGIRDRLEAISSGSTLSQLDPNTAPLGVDEDDDDYEPDFQVAEDTEQILNKLDVVPPTDVRESDAMVMTTYVVPEPPIITVDEIKEIGRHTISRVFGTMQTAQDATSKKPKAGINRLAGSNNDKDAWITVISRLATRPTSGIEDENTDTKDDMGMTASLANTIRESLYNFVLEDFRRRTDVAMAWLCEEWYNDTLQLQSGSKPPILQFEKWSLKVLDGILPYLDAKDKFLTRFLAEVPTLSSAALSRVKELCRDPEKVAMALNSLLYVVMMKPPARESALDTMQDIWEQCEYGRQSRDCS
jgi:symplekin